MKAFLSSLCAAAALSMLAGAPARAQTELKLGHVGEPGSLFQISADEFARRVNAEARRQGRRSSSTAPASSAATRR